MKNWNDGIKWNKSKITEIMIKFSEIMTEKTKIG